MKNTFKFSIFLFLLSCMYIMGARVVSAVDNNPSEFFSAIKDYTIIKKHVTTIEGNVISTQLEHHDKRESDNYNFYFDYAYSLEASEESEIYDGNHRISIFYGVVNNTSINYVDVPNISVFNKIHDTMTIYKYRYADQTFIFHQSYTDKEGTYNITEEGLYKIETTGVPGNSKVVYLIYDKKVSNIEIEEVEYINNPMDSNYKKNMVTLNVKSPRALVINDNAVLSNSCLGEIAQNSLKIGTTSASVVSCTATKKENVGDYKVEIVFSPINDAIKNADLELVFSNVKVSKEDAVNYDNAIPNFGHFGLTYYNSSLIHDSFSFKLTGMNQSVSPYELYGNVSLVVGKNTVIFSVSDHNEIVATLNSNECLVEKEQGQVKNVITCEFEVSENDDSVTLNYLVADSYNNVLEMRHVIDKIDKTFIEGDIKQYLEISEENNTVRVKEDAPQNVKDEVNVICILYGSSLEDAYNCGTEGSLSVASKFAYKGDIKILIVDSSHNFVLVDHTLEEGFKNGYVLADFTKDNTPDNYDLSKDLERLVAVACGANVRCIESVKKYVKYGNLVEELSSEEVLPTYLEILNTKFRDSTCSKGECNKSVDVYITYDVGNGSEEQTLNMVYNFVDNSPYINDSIALVETLSFEYKDFDINSIAIKNSLYGIDTTYNMVDPLGKNHIGKLEPVFVQYTDRLGNKSILSNKPYTYIAEANLFGYYLLEVKVKLLQVEEDGEWVDHPENTYSKSFFVTVELKDTIRPTLTLVGDKEVVVKQYDVYKDAGYKCEDASLCTVKLVYYLNDKNNKVEEINTKVAGKYIIEYVAVDGDGNTITATRTVVVEEVNTLNVTSIVIISLVVVAFVGFLVLGIVHERKKGKKEIISDE